MMQYSNIMNEVDWIFFLNLQYSIFSKYLQTAESILSKIIERTIKMSVSQYITKFCVCSSLKTSVNFKTKFHMQFGCIEIKSKVCLVFFQNFPNKSHDKRQEWVKYLQFLLYKGKKLSNIIIQFKFSSITEAYYDC